MARNMHPEDIKATVRKTGISLAALGRQNGVLSNTMRKSLHVPCPKGNRVIAAHLRKKLSDLWPEWYDAEGNRIPSTGRKGSSGGPVRHRQKRSAA